MVKRKLETWNTSLNRLKEEARNRLDCGGLTCENCILRNKGNMCERSKILEAIINAEKRVREAIKDLKKCPTCGKIMDGED